MKSARKAMQQMLANSARSGISVTGFYRLGPSLVCEQGAKLRNLDIEVAATDAKYWWKNGKVPLRATQLAGRKEAKRERDWGRLRRRTNRGG